MIIIKDQQFEILMKTGCPGTQIRKLHEQKKSLSDVEGDEE